MMPCRSSESVQTAIDEAAKLVNHRTAPHIDAKVGEKLTAKLRTADNPKGMALDDIIAAWDVHRKEPGWMAKEEFVQSVVATLSEMTLKRAKSEAAKLGSEIAEVTEAPLKEQNVFESDIEAAFDAIDRAQVGEGGEPRGKVDTKAAIGAMIEADKVRRATDAALLESCAKLKGAAVETQATVKETVDAFLLAEKTAAAEKAAAEEAEKQAAAAAKAAASAAKKEAIVNPQAKLPAWMQLEPEKKADKAAEVIEKRVRGVLARQKTTKLKLQKSMSTADGTSNDEDPLLAKLAALDGTGDAPAVELS